MKNIALGLVTLLCAACASYGGSGLQPGVATLAEVEAAMGAPALRWPEPDGGQSLAFPRGPAGFHTYVARFRGDGRLIGLRNVLEPSTFALVRAGMTQEEVLHLLGPPFPGWTTYFEQRDELVWEWRFCDDWGEAARFNVLFSGTTGQVRTTMALTERQSMPFGSGNRRSWCSR